MYQWNVLRNLNFEVRTRKEGLVRAGKVIILLTGRLNQVEIEVEPPGPSESGLRRPAQGTNRPFPREGPINRGTKNRPWDV